MFMRGFYNAGQAMIVKQRELDTIANNINNINTPGYRKDEITLNTFMDELIWVQRRRATHSGTFQQTYVEESRTNLEQGSLEFTQSRFDFAIFGNVYFNVTDRAGNTYQTRAGQFELDDEGYLTMGIIGRVQGENGDIYIGHDDFWVSSDGVIYTEDGDLIDTLLLTYIPPDAPAADVRKVGNNLFEYIGGAAMPDDERFDIIQGAFEKSNVDPNKEMVRIIELQRLFEASSAALKAFDMINQRNADMAKLNR
jgi:flagellar basal body rod protein FlgG